MRALSLAWAGLVLSAAAATAQDAKLCRPTETINECRSRVVPTGGVPQTAEQAGAAADQAGRALTSNRLQAKQVGPDLTAADAPSATRNFLPRLAATLIAASTGGAPGDLGFDGNLPLTGNLPFGARTSVQLGVVVHKAQVSSRVAAAIPASRRAEARDRLQAGLEVFDDMSFTGALNAESRVFGRSLRPHQPEVSRLAADVIGLRPTPDVTNTEELRLEGVDQAALSKLAADPTSFLPGRGDDPACHKNDPNLLSIGCFTVAARLQIQAQIDRQAAAAAAPITRDSTLLVNAGFLYVAQLINNQPQLNATAEYRSRTGVVGANEWTGMGRVEVGLANMNGLRRSCRGPLTAACLTNYLDRKHGYLQRGDRLWAQVDWSRRNRWHVRRAGDSLDLRVKPALTYALSGGYGAYFGNAAEDENRDHLDVNGKYDVTRDDPIRQNRFVATASYTHRIDDQSAAIIGLTYASRPEFLGDVDHRLGGNIGFTYRVKQKGSGH